MVPGDAIIEWSGQLVMETSGDPEKPDDRRINSTSQNLATYREEVASPAIHGNAYRVQLNMLC